ncbi:hypothetical protein [Pedobacter aquatilis]|uniref:hypothetical protein n=1 Tax=Pedobacter aquatilis TaxID=351343 RepID=UPI002931DF0B|nr:hypothetical protein [Pedobacter aquatilis]
MKAEKDIDKLFKAGLENPDVPFNEMDWAAMDKKLDRADKRRIIPFYWISAAAGIAAMLVIAFLIFKPAQKPAPQISYQNKSKSNGKVDTIELAKSSDKAEPNNKQNTIDNTIPSIAKNNLIPLKEKPQPRFSAAAFSTNSEINSASQNLLANAYSQKLTELNQNKVDFEKTQLNTKINFKALPIPTEAIKRSSNKPMLSLGFTAAPDLTSVQGSGQSSLSGGLGLELTLSVSKKLSITTGAAYAKKLYDSDFSRYNPNSSYVFRNQPINIHANCDVLDIPINVNYKLLGNSRNSLILTTGLSSYLMLREKYDYTYQNPDVSGPTTYQVRNQNQHLLGVANIGVTFQHKINNKFAVGISPFMKIPLTEIGYGNSKLSSTGVAVTVSMTDLFRKK